MTTAHSEPITIRKALIDARQSLKGDEANLEAEVLFRHSVGIDRASLYQRLDDPLTAPDSETFADHIARRRAREPLAYITGHREFFALDFEVTPAALIPRPETETLVELVITFAHERFADRPIVIADIGTGSGIIAVCLATALLNARIIATDVSRDALALACRNAGNHCVSDRIDFREGDLIAPLDGLLQIIVANLPYVTSQQWEESTPEIRDHEPRLALDGGTDGLAVIRRLLAEAPVRLADDGALFCEIGAWQGDAARELAIGAFPEAHVEVASDLAGHDRVLTVASRQPADNLVVG